MPKSVSQAVGRYLSTEDVKDAVERLEGASPFGRMFDLLIGLRTLALTPGGKSGLGLSAKGYIEAANELGRWTDDPDASTPFFNPFSPKGDGYRAEKWLSNGPPSNIWKWPASANPFEVHDDGAVKQISRGTPDPKTFQKYFAGTNPAKRPRLLDVAIWYFRNTEFPEDDLPSDDDLKSRFVDAMGLSEDEIDLLFKPEDE